MSGEHEPAVPVQSLAVPDLLTGFIQHESGGHVGRNSRVEIISGLNGRLLCLDCVIQCFVADHLPPFAVTNRLLNDLLCIMSGSFLLSKLWKQSDVCSLLLLAIAKVSCTMSPQKQTLILKFQSITKTLVDAAPTGPFKSTVFESIMCQLRSHFDTNNVDQFLSTIGLESIHFYLMCFHDDSMTMPESVDAMLFDILLVVLDGRLRVPIHILAIETLIAALHWRPTPNPVMFKLIAQTNFLKLFCEANTLLLRRRILESLVLILPQLEYLDASLVSSYCTSLELSILSNSESDRMDSLTIVRDLVRISPSTCLSEPACIQYLTEQAGRFPNGTTIPIIAETLSLLLSSGVGLHLPSVFGSVFPLLFKWVFQDDDRALQTTAYQLLMTMLRSTDVPLMVLLDGIGIGNLPVSKAFFDVLLFIISNDRSFLWQCIGLMGQLLEDYIPDGFRQRQLASQLDTIWRESELDIDSCSVLVQFLLPVASDWDDVWLEWTRDCSVVHILPIMLRVPLDHDGLILPSFLSLIDRICRRSPIHSTMQYFRVLNTELTSLLLQRCNFDSTDRIAHQLQDYFNRSFASVSSDIGLTRAPSFIPLLSFEVDGVLQRLCHISEDDDRLLLLKLLRYFAVIASDYITARHSRDIASALIDLLDLHEALSDIISVIISTGIPLSKGDLSKTISASLRAIKSSSTAASLLLRNEPAWNWLWQRVHDDVEKRGVLVRVAVRALPFPALWSMSSDLQQLLGYAETEQETISILKHIGTASQMIDQTSDLSLLSLTKSLPEVKYYFEVEIDRFLALDIVDTETRAALLCAVIPNDPSVNTGSLSQCLPLLVALLDQILLDQIASQATVVALLNGAARLNRFVHFDQDLVSKFFSTASVTPLHDDIFQTLCGIIAQHPSCDLSKIGHHVMILIEAAISRGSAAAILFLAMLKDMWPISQTNGISLQLLLVNLSLSSSLPLALLYLGNIFHEEFPNLFTARAESCLIRRMLATFHPGIANIDKHSCEQCRIWPITTHLALFSVLTAPTKAI